jgi:hypothetical protein
MGRAFAISIRGSSFAVGLTLALAVSSLVSTAEAARPQGMQPLLNPDGSGRLFANQGGPDDQIHWESCFPDESTCTPAPAGREVSTGDDPIGTVYRYGSDNVSLPWGGRVVSLGPPSLSGVVRANELVTPVSAGWHGGWPDDREATQLAACVNADGTNCVSLTDPKYLGGCPNGAAVVDPYFTGRYLKVAIARLGEGTVTTLEAHTSPYSQNVEGEASAIYVVRVYGPIEPAVAPREAPCGPGPITEAQIDRKGVATIRCVLDCDATMIARRKGKIVARIGAKVGATSFRGDDQAPTLRFAKAARRRLAGLKASLTVLIQDHPAAVRALRFGKSGAGAS